MTKISLAEIGAKLKIPVPCVLKGWAKTLFSNNLLLHGE